ncbi:MAG: C10 family peptidase [Bacteroidaceae bacterium]|nr:C10 family peptidase [Bacteroidaceae bacterium]
MSFKTFLLTCCVFAVFSACEQSDMLDDVTPNENHGQYDESKCYDFNVDMKTAAYAAGFLDSTSIVNIEPITFDSDTIMYAVNYVEGWKLFSADMRVTPVLVSSPTGSFNYESQITGSKLWIQNIASNLIELRKNKSGVSYDELVKNQDYQFWKQMYLCAYAEKVCSATDSLKKSSRRKAINSSYTIRKYLCKRLLHTQIVENKTGLVNKRLETKWHQDEPFNEYCPSVRGKNGYLYQNKPKAGCASVAMAQWLYFAHYKFNTPAGLNHGAKFEGIYPEDPKYIPGTFCNPSMRWDKMAKDEDDTSVHSSQYVAELIAELGEKMGMHYTYTESYVKDEKTDFNKVLKQYGLTCDKAYFNSNTVIDNLKEGLPVLIYSFATEDTESFLFWSKRIHHDGHVWVIDGLSENTIVTRNEYVWEIVEAIESNDTRDGEPHMSRPLPPMEHHRITSEDDGLREEEPEVWANLEIYNSKDELRHSYLEVKDYDTAIRQGLVAGKREVNYPQTTKYSFLMKWGLGIDEKDNILYSADASEFGEYKYATTIFYNLRKNQ